jgi:hypothetical protein
MECHYAGMDPGMVAIPCPSCQASSESPGPGQTHWSCPACHRSYFLRRCAGCQMVSHVSALQGWHQRWACVWCHAANTGFSQHRDPAAATVADLAADVKGHGLRFGAGEPDQATQPFPELPVAPAPAGPVTSPGPVAPAGQAAAGGPAAGAGPATGDRRPRPGRPGRWRPGSRVAAAAVAVLALVVLAVAVGELSAGGPGGPARAGSPPGSRAVAVTASAVGTVDLRGVPGLLTIVGARSGRVRLTGVLHWSGRAAPVATRRLDRDGVLHLSYRCAPASPCTEDYRLVVPGRTATVIRQPSGHVIVSGVAGALRIVAASVDVSATGLRSPTLAAQITSGHLSASFAVAPRQISVALVSAQATVRLPGGVGYLVSSQVSSGFVHVGIPQVADSTRTVSARIDQGELQLLTT